MPRRRRPEEQAQVLAHQRQGEARVALFGEQRVRQIAAEDVVAAGARAERLGERLELHAAFTPVTRTSPRAVVMIAVSMLLQSLVI